MKTLDALDRRILDRLQHDAGLGVEALGDEIGLSRNACWRRVKALEEAGYILRRVALVDAEKVGLPLTVFILIRTNRHEPDWLEKFRRATDGIPEILGAYRMTGNLDYLVRARVADMAGYDRLYQRLIRTVEMSDVSASFVMEELKETTVLPL